MQVRVLGSQCSGRSVSGSQYVDRNLGVSVCIIGSKSCGGRIWVSQCAVGVSQGSSVHVGVMQSQCVGRSIMGSQFAGGSQGVSLCR